MLREPKLVREKFGTKKVLEPVREKFVTEKSIYFIYHHLKNNARNNMDANLVFRDNIKNFSLSLSRVRDENKNLFHLILWFETRSRN